MNILVGCTGSVASLKLPLLVQQLIERFSVTGEAPNIKVIVTKHAVHFFSAEDLPPSVQLLRDEDEWTSWRQRGDPVLHIELAKWAHLMLIAPLDANTLAKMANGMCDNLLTCVTRAWLMEKPLLFCPAMNTRMWEHPVTAPQLVALRAWGHVEVPCVTKTLVCGDTGLGAMAEVATIVEYVARHLNMPSEN